MTKILGNKMLIFLKKTILLIMALFIIITLSGCALIVVPIDHLCMACQGERDLSDDFARGHVVGKEYETVEEVYLTQYDDSKLIRFVKYPVRAFPFTNGNTEINVNIYSMIKPIPPKTRFRVCKVLASTSFGKEISTQNILATLIDDQGNSITTHNSQGKPAFIYVTYLFKETSQAPNQNWIFYPSELIKEINKCD